MIPVRDIPISSVTWLLGSVAILILGIRSYFSYRRSQTELLKYAAWFATVIGISLAFFSVPSFFTLNPSVLLKWDLVGEILYYASMVVQASIVWLLVLRKYVSVYAVTVPVALLSLSAWIYSVLRGRVVVSQNFIDYFDPRYSTFVLGGLLLVLFLPVGIYFLRLAPRQHGLKSVMNSVVFGVAYIGIGLTTGIIEIVTGKVIDRKSAPGIMAFFVALLIIGLWPRRTGGAMPIAPAAGAQPTAPVAGAPPIAGPPPAAPGPTTQPPLPPDGPDQNTDTEKLPRPPY